MQLQLLGGIWIIQTFPAVIFGSTRACLNGWALLIGWAAGIAHRDLDGGRGELRADLSAEPLRITTIPCYIALSSLVVNLVVSVVLSLLFNPVVSDRHRDVTTAGDYA